MQTIRVLIVEDDPMVLEINAEFVSKLEGFEVIAKTGSGTEALIYVETCCPDLVLLDYFLPDMNGLALLQRIRSHDFPVDVIMLTANRDSMHIQEIFRAGASDYIVKPFRFERFQSSLAQYRRMKKKWTESRFLNQDELDELTGMLSGEIFGRLDEVLPKGLNERTMQQILQFLHDQSTPRSAEEVAAGTGLARVTARRYLEFLQKKGEIQIEVQYGSVGRPINRYRI
jgi:two-component system, CitB family, response regulator DctR